MTDPAVRLAEPTFGEDEIAAVVDVLRSGRVTAGEKVRAFEAAIEAMFPGRHAVVCNSGSSANLLAVAERCSPLRSHGRLFAGHHVVVPALAWSTTVWPLVQHGIVPIVVDIDPQTLNIDIEQIRDALIDRDASAIMLVHVYGNPCDLAGIQELIGSHGPLALIEDCCEAMGAMTRGRAVGSFGDAATFSFYFSHHISTIEGGVVITPDPDAAERMRIIRAHGWLRDCRGGSGHLSDGLDPRFTFVDAGYNLRLTEMQAAMGLVQLPKLPGFVATRRRVARALQAVFEPVEWLQVQRELHGASSWFGFPLIVSEDAPMTAADLRQRLEAAGIETRSLIAGNMARQPGMSRYPHIVHGDLPNADAAMRRGFSIGCHQAMTVEHVQHIAETMQLLT